MRPSYEISLNVHGTFINVLFDAKVSRCRDAYGTGDSPTLIDIDIYNVYIDYLDEDIDEDDKLSPDDIEEQLIEYVLGN